MRREPGASPGRWPDATASAASADVGRLLEEDIDAVLMATPDRSHLPLASAALNAGKHVLVEKPLADTVAGAEELAGLALSED